VAFDHGEDYTVRLREHTDTTLLPGVILVATTTDVEEEDGHDQYSIIYDEHFLLFIILR
jgi:hypothetical protein